MPKYVAFDNDNGEIEDFVTFEDAVDWLKSPLGYAIEGSYIAKITHVVDERGNLKSVGENVLVGNGSPANPYRIELRHGDVVRSWDEGKNEYRTLVLGEAKPDSGKNLYEWRIDCGRSGVWLTAFIDTAANVAAFAGKKFYISEPFGRHSWIEGELEESMFELAVVNISIDNLPGANNPNVR